MSDGWDPMDEFMPPLGHGGLGITDGGGELEKNKFQNSRFILIVFHNTDLCYKACEC